MNLYFFKLWRLTTNDRVILLFLIEIEQGDNIFNTSHKFLEIGWNCIDRYLE